MTETKTAFAPSAQAGLKLYAIAVVATEPADNMTCVRSGWTVALTKEEAHTQAMQSSYQTFPIGEGYRQHAAVVTEVSIAALNRIAQRS